jgi:tetratricopeptide (TPR) repeat protein
MAYLAEPEPNLSGVWSQWKRKRTQLLCRPGGKTRLSNAAVSFELSVTGSRMTPEARRLLSIAALLPDGIAHKDLDALLPNKTEEATQVLRAVGLAHDEQGRLRLLAPVREYIAAAHPPEEADGLRVLRHYIGLVEIFGPQVGGEGGAEAIIRLASDLANIEAMIRLGLRTPDPSAAIEAATKLSSFWALSGFGTGNLLKEATIFFRNQPNFQGLANCIQSLGAIAFRRSDHDAASALYEEALLLYRRGGCVLGEANCIKSLGNIAFERSDYDAASVRYEEALLLYRRIGAVLGEANCIRSLGDIALERSDHGAAHARYEKALPLYRRIGVILGEANCIRSLGNVAFRQSDHGAAHARYEKALPLYRRVGDVLGEANCIQSLGDIALEWQDHDAAGTLYKEALLLYRRVGAVLGEANCIQSLGDIALRRLDHNAARAQFETALKLYERIQEPYSIGWAHRRLAPIANNDTACQYHLATARKAWKSIDRYDLVQLIDAKSSITA